MDVKLVVLRGAKPAKVRLRLPTTIGRSPDASLKLSNTKVSRRHCELFEGDGRLMVRDLGSANGTFVDEQRVEGEAVLPPGGVLSVGPIALRAQYEGPRDAPAADDSVINLDMEESGDEASRSVVKYRETAEGSVINIEDEDESAETVDEATIEDEEEEVTEFSAVASRGRKDDEAEIAIELDNPAAQEVVHGDSALNDFFKNLE